MKKIIILLPPVENIPANVEDIKLVVKARNARFDFIAKEITERFPEVFMRYQSDGQKNIVTTFIEVKLYQEGNYQELCDVVTLMGGLIELMTNEPLYDAMEELMNKNTD